MATFVSIGNATQPFLRLLNAVGILAEEDVLPKPIVVQHGHTKFVNDKCICIPFLQMEEFAKYIQTSSVILLHAGAGSIIQACQSHKLPLIMARQAQFNEHIDNHQVEFAHSLKDNGRVIVIENVDEMRSAVKNVLLQQPSFKPELLPEPLMVGLVRNAILNISNTNLV